LSDQPSGRREHKAITGKSETETRAINQKEVYFGLFDEQIPKERDSMEEDEEVKNIFT
jgi:hypothetical protein